MGSVMEMRMHFRKMLNILIRTCYRSVCNHPFLVGMLCFLVFLYRSFPFVFSILVSASPILVCTAVLLGTLLSFGQPNIPEIEKEESVTHAISSFQTGFLEGATVTSERDESSTLNRYKEENSEVEERGIEEASFVEDTFNKVPEDDYSLSYVPLVDENSQDISQDKLANERRERGFCSLVLENKRGVHEEKLKDEGVLSEGEDVEDQYILGKNVNDEILENENEKSPREFLDDSKGDHLAYSPGSSWKQGEDDEGEDGSLESGSDGAESSSPDASMADIIPMLDELHPLLDSEAPHPAHMLHDASYAASDKSNDSSSIDSDEDVENQGDEGEEGGVDVHDDEEEEEEMKGGKEDESKSAIKWTEDDQKNLLDLGTSDLERNQRLEKLIARRRARRNLSLMAEKNLIDLESADLPFNFAPISTARHNPFNVPDYSYGDMGLPPIPGSAPSILHPRRNPFDIPYDPKEEKPDLKGDSFQQEFMLFNQKDAFFGRHESFSLGPSGFGGFKQDRQDIKWKPIFVPERLASEGTSQFPFQRQSSEVSDSKLSSVPDTESVTSADQDEIEISEQDFSQDIEVITNIDHVSDHVHKGSLSSGYIDSVEIKHVDGGNTLHDEVEITLGGVENTSEIESNSETREVAIPQELNTNEIHLRIELVDDESSSRSSRSSLSEVIDNLPDEKKEELASLEQGDRHFQESRISFARPSIEESNFQFTSGEVEDSQRKNPVYDSSPPAVEKFHFFSSISSDTLVEMSERGSPTASVQITGPLADKESELQNEIIESKSSCEEMHVTSSQLPVEGEKESRSRDTENMNQHAEREDELSVVDPSFVDNNGVAVPESVVEHFTIDSGLSSDIGPAGGLTNEEEGIVQEPDPNDSTSIGSDVIMKKLYSSASSHQNDSSILCALDEQKSSVLVEHVSENVNSFLSESELVEEHEIVKEVTLQLERAQIHSSSSSDDESAENSLDKFVVAPSIDDQGGRQNLSSCMVDSTQAVSITNNEDLQNIHDATDKVPLNPSSVPSDSSLTESPEYKSPVGGMDLKVDMLDGNISKNHIEVLDHFNHLEEAYKSQIAEEIIEETGEMKDIDEAILSELDTVGDFSVRDADESLHHELILEETNVGSTKFGTLPKDSSVQDGETLHSELIPEETKVRNGEAGFFPNELNTTGSSQEHSVLQARSLEEIDVAFQQLHEGVDVKEVIFPSMIDGQLVMKESKDQLETNSDLLVIEAGSVDDIHIAIKQVSESGPKELTNAVDSDNGSAKVEVVTRETGFLLKDLSTTESEQELPVLEARSLEDIDVAFKQLHEGVDVKEVILPSMIEDQLVMKESKDQLETDSDLLVIEARSVDDIHITIKQVSEGSPGVLPKALDSDNGPAKLEAVTCEAGFLPKELSTTESEKELPVLEARSLEDIDVAFKQLHEGVDVKEVILPTTIEDKLVLEESKYHLETNSDLQVIEARSVDDIHIAVTQASEGSSEELPKSLNSEDGSTDVEANGEGLAKVIESCHVGNGETRIPADKSEHLSNEPSENPALSSCSTRSKKERSHSDSSSSSSSSSCSSDSD
ncbi:Ulp1 protease family C-terminal catalytic domain containing protein expressed [Quillaja saponaria]|uniref:Ulp1 protease family C-terminal catalytic domain containing protein expressed n=1 Tax=Quillaja saponaria TaxID=32244 RepID=A0AAD7VI53_QUISA|nr:Ulp1 protease family C-terminal catalytic domain containing protein expressed [Quillaja saponaria]